MKIVVIGAVAAGTSAAAKARRNNEDAEIIIYEKDQHISYSGCGLPYYIGGEIDNIQPLTPRDSQFFKDKYNIDIRTGHVVTEIHPDLNTLFVTDLAIEKSFIQDYDYLILATGAAPFVPEIPGIKNDHVFTLRNVQSAIQIKNYIQHHQPQNAVILGTGFIGFEMLENLMNEDINVTILEKESHITPNLDEDMALYLENSLAQRGIPIIKNAYVRDITTDRVILEDGSELKADMVIVATGVRLNTKLAQSAGVLCGGSGGIIVNPNMQTNYSNIYACGDCIETFSLLTGKPVYRPLGSTANKTGRIAGDAVTGGNLAYRGNLGTGIFKLYDLTIAATGLTEKEALSEGYDVITCHNIKPDKPVYFHGKEMLIKGIADKKTGRLLGTQIIGYEGVDKRVDVFATLITYGATVDELFHLDLAYAPPFSTTKDPVHYTGMILDNALHGNRPLMTSADLERRVTNGETVQIIDARAENQYESSHLPNALNLPQKEMRNALEHLDKEALTLTYCNKGVTGNAAQNILIHNGFTRAYNLSGGHKFYTFTREE